MKRILLSLATILLLTGVAMADYEPMHYVSYQGYLAHNGVAVTGTKTITFTLYDAITGGSELCNSGAQSITVTNGLFSYAIGSNNCDTISIDWYEEVYLEINVEGVTFSPRELITGSAYTVRTIKSEFVTFPPYGDISAEDVETAIRELEDIKVAKAGDTMTGDLDMGTNNITNAGTVAATNYTGDGSALTGISTNDTTKVLKAGDTMTGDLNMGANDITNAGTVAATNYTGDGSALTGVNDTTKVLKTGDTMSGTLEIRTNDTERVAYFENSSESWNPIVELEGDTSEELLKGSQDGDGGLFSFRADSVGGVFEVNNYGVMRTSAAGTEEIASGSACEFVPAGFIFFTSLVLVTPVTTDNTIKGLRVDNIEPGNGFTVCNMDDSAVVTDVKFHYLIFGWVGPS